MMVDERIIEREYWVDRSNQPSLQDRGKTHNLALYYRETKRGKFFSGQNCI
jgi:hypothetical protein